MDSKPDYCATDNKEKLYMETPVMYSFPLSKHAGFKVYLKLDNLQPSGSFKIRGISNMIQKGIDRGDSEHVYCASGGNAGMAAAHASKQLGIPCTIVVPQTTPEFVNERLRNLGAEVKVHGSVYDEAKKLAVELGSQPRCMLIPAFEHPDIWEGHASLINESSRQMSERPDLVITCVGGGGLLNGIVQGMRDVGWDEVPVLAMETHGANCFNAAIAAGEAVFIPAITSIAKSLGSLIVSPQTLEYYKQACPRILNEMVSDNQVIDACVRFSDDHRFLVEPACGASLAAVYSNVVKQLQDSGKLGTVKSVLVVVCGGSIVSTAVMEKWKADFGM
ncbi:serine dehydratase isoform X1 [Aplysia californica]|uniref:L-serine ammonia-lyase n=1 Tax=Aplysia californica TaxID=6500 RepID=A0ABM0ZXQ8_APLCA|nr:serine dehydratase isoform X1 [Aplysia californica]XP_035825042.1 serine dehydratase isoform X1 [Aplysia californica]